MFPTYHDGRNHGSWYYCVRHHSGGIILVVATMTTMRIISLFYRQYHWLGLPITMMITIFIGGTVKGS